MSHMTTTWFPDRVGLAASVLASVVLMSAIGFAQSKPTVTPVAIAGKYEGWARETPDGDLATRVTIVQNGSTFTGTMAAGGYSFTISDGKVDGDKVSWRFSDGEVNGSVTATYEAGAINGSWWAGAGGTGALELKKSATKQTGGAAGRQAPRSSPQMAGSGIHVRVDSTAGIEHALTRGYLSPLL
jgi:hypothetical protein